MLVFLTSLALAAPPIDGTFQPSISQAEVDARLTQAATDASQQFNWLIRGIARGKILEQATACSTLKLMSNATHTGVKCDAEASIVRLNDNSEPPFDRDGTTVDSVVAIQGNTLSLTWATEDGSRKTLYTFRDDDNFDLRVEVASPQMDTPMSFTIPYRRTGPTSGLQ